MDTPLIVFLSILGLIILIGIGFLITAIALYPFAKKLYASQWVRTNKEQFKRGCSDESVPYHLDMFNQGLKIREKYKDNIVEVFIKNDGLNLYGEYYNFNFKKTIIFIPGRTESCLYGAFYLEPFIKAKCNVLLIDPRAHGLSDGEYLTLGEKEALDIIAWTKFLHKKFDIQTVGLYCLCGGSTAGIYALGKYNAPSYIKFIIVDGMYYSFYKVYARHIKEKNRPTIPIIFEIMHLIKKNNKVNPYKTNGKNYLDKVNVPLLMMYGDKEQYTIEKERNILFSMVKSEIKEFKYISNARHSHLRYDNKEEYDNIVIDFINRLKLE